MIKRIFSIVFLSIIGYTSSIWAGFYWTNTILSNYTFTESYGINTLVIATWLATLVIFTVVGVILKIIHKENNKYKIPISLGILSGIIWFIMQKTIFIQSPTIIDMIWSYSELLMPLIGSTLGWFIYKITNKQLHPTQKDVRVN